MEIINILFITKDLIYAEIFVEAIARNASFIIIEIANEVKDETEYDYVIADVGCEDVHADVFLVEKIQCSDVLKIFRYSKVDDLVTSLIYAYTIITGNQHLRGEEKKTKIYSLLGFIKIENKKNIIEEIIEGIDEEYEPKILQLNIDSIDKYAIDIKVNDNKNKLVLFLYYLFTHNYSRISAIDKFIIKNEIGAFSFYNDIYPNVLNMINKEEIKAFFDYIVKISYFDFVFVEIGNTINENVEYINDISNKIFINTKEEDEVTTWIKNYYRRKVSELDKIIELNNSNDIDMLIKTINLT